MKSSSTPAVVMSLLHVPADCIAKLCFSYRQLTQASVICGFMFHLTDLPVTNNGFPIFIDSDTVKQIGDNFLCKMDKIELCVICVMANKSE